MNRKFTFIIIIAVVASALTFAWRTSARNADTSASGSPDRSTEATFSAVDSDGDGVDDLDDNCINTANADQLNVDSDLDGDACDGYPLLPFHDSIVFTNTYVAGDVTYGFSVIDLDEHNKKKLLSSYEIDGDRFPDFDGRVAFFSSQYRDGNLEIYAQNADGSGITRLTNDPAEDSLPMHSPDGSRVVYTSERDGNSEIYIMGADGTNPTRLTNSSGEDSSPAFNPAGTKIAFSSQRDINDPQGWWNADIYLMNIDGTGVTRLTSFNYNQSPSFSPDGSKIIFSNEDNGSGDGGIWTINVDGTGLTRLIQSTEGLDNLRSPSISNDGSLITFDGVVEGDPFTSVHLANADGTYIREIYYDGTNPSFVRPKDIDGDGVILDNCPSNSNSDQLDTDGDRFGDVCDADDDNDGVIDTADNCSITVNPDQINTDGDVEGDACDADDDNDGVNDVSDSCPLTANGYRIAFASNRSGNYEIYTMNADGTGVSRITNNAAIDDEPSFDSTGSRILFTSDRSGRREIYVMNADGTGVTPLTNFAGGNGEAVFNPQRTKIAFTSRRFDNNENLFLMDADGSNQVQLTFFTATSTFAKLPSFNHNGTRIVFESQRGTIGNSQWDIYSINPDGTGETRLTTTPGQDSNPSFSKDGSKIVYAAGNTEIYVMNADGTNPTRITNNPAVDNSPVFSPDGTKIAFYSDRDADSELYVMKVDGTGVTRVTSASGSSTQPSFGPQADTDGDGVGDACDNCSASNPGQEDTDGDRVADACDNCSMVSNPNQANNDGDALGDACDPDDDNDGVLDIADNCPFTANADQANNDGDSLGDVCDPDDDNDGVNDGPDNCNFTPNPDQADTDGDETGDACDPDDDNDGVLDGVDNCPLFDNPDQEDTDLDGIGDTCDDDDDNDGIVDKTDNCSLDVNPDQADGDGDNIGDVCDPSFDVALPMGSDVTIEAPNAAVTFSGVTEEGVTSFVQLALGQGDLPNGYALCPTCPAYEITTTGTYTPPITVCFAVPLPTTQPEFLLLRLLHGENGVFVDRTTDHVTNMDGTRVVCGVVDSLSPFTLATSLAPTAAEVSIGGRVSNANGQGIQNALITLTAIDGTRRTIRTGSFGFYRFDDINAGETYILSIASKRFTFASPTIIIIAADELNNVDFTATPLE